MNTKLTTFPGPFLTLKASRAIPHLLASDNVVIDGHCYWPGFDPGIAAFPSMGFQGYIWPYAEEGRSIDEPPDI